MGRQRMLLMAVGTVLLLLLAAGLSQAQAPAGGTPQAIGTAFTYQGQLKRDGSLYSGTCNMEFKLYDAASGGSQVAPTQSRTGVAVDAGLFTIPDLDFGLGVFGGEARWLQVAVQCGGDPAFTTLEPRQEMTPAPYAVYASSVGPHSHWGETWSGSGVGLDLYAGDVGLRSSGGSAGVEGWTSSTMGASAGLRGTAIASTGGAAGLEGWASSPNGHGVRGYNQSTGGSAPAVWGYTYSTAGHGVQGWAGASTGTTAGVYGLADSPSGRGVYGYASANTGLTYGVYGEAASTAGVGVEGWASASSGVTYGVWGLVSSPSGVGVVGQAAASTGQSYGVNGISAGQSGRGVYGLATHTTGTTYGVYGQTASSAGYGVYGQAPATGVYGIQTATTFGCGVCGVTQSWIATASGVSGHGDSASGGHGVRATSDGPSGDGAALWAEAYHSSGIAMWGRNTSEDTTLVLENYGAGDLIRAFVSGGELRFRVTNDGDVRSDAGFHTPAADMAEMLPAAAGLGPGDVLVIGPDGRLDRSSQPYQPTAAGVYSTRPGFVGGSGIAGDPDDRVPLAVVGVVPVKASAENGSIRPGDLLVASATPGHGMRACANPPVGTVIGKALEGLERGTGIILMLVVLQ